MEALWLSRFHKRTSAKETPNPRENRYDQLYLASGQIVLIQQPQALNDLFETCQRDSNQLETATSNPTNPNR